MAFPSVECAFRYDLLCIEGIARALRVFLGKGKAPDYRLVHPSGGQNLIEVTVAPEVRVHRPFLVSCSESVADGSSPPLLRLCCPSKCQIYATLVRLVHRPTRQVTSEHLPQATVRRHWHT